MTAPRSPRTFSLATLLLAITLLSLLCGLAVNYPAAAAFFTFSGGLFSPAIIIWLVMLRYSNQRATLTFSSFLGAFFGVFLFQFLSPGLPLGWQFGFWIDFMICAMFPAIAVLLFGGAALADEILNRRKTEDQPSQP